MSGQSVVKVYSQADLDASLQCTDDIQIWICGTGEFQLRNGRRVVCVTDSAHVVAMGSAHVVAWDSAHVVAWGSAHVVAMGSAHVVAWGSAHVVAWDSAHVVAWGSVQVRALDDRVRVKASTQLVVISKHAVAAKVDGGTVIDVPPVTTPEQWCEYYGVLIVNGMVTLYKGVDEQYRSPRGGIYTPGTTPSAPDWDGGKAECGGGLHFSPHPEMTLQFNNSDAKRFVACPVRVDEIAVHHPAEYPGKVKAPRVCAPIYEVDRRGRRIAPASTVAATV